MLQRVNTFRSQCIVYLSILIFGIYSCMQNYDRDLMVPDGYNGGMNYTNLGLLVHASWSIDSSTGYNTRIFLNQKEILDKGYDYNTQQKDLVFDLHKDGSIRYWLKSENDKVNNTKDGSIVIRKQTEEEDNLKKYYTKGFWKANFQDSSLTVHFLERNIPEINFKINWLSTEDGSFSQTYYIDSVINGKKVILKKVNTFVYEHLFWRF